MKHNLETLKAMTSDPMMLKELGAFEKELQAEHDRLFPIVESYLTGKPMGERHSLRNQLLGRFQMACEVLGGGAQK